MSANVRVLDLAGRPMKDEEPRGVARLRRGLGNRLGRQVVVEVVDTEARRGHAPDSVAPGRRTGRAPSVGGAA